MKIAVCFCVKPSTTGGARSDGFEKDYQNVYKPAAKFLYSHPNCCMAFSFYGPQLAHLKRRHPEFIEIVRELIGREQIELLGGGFYNPVFPLLFPRDRSGQIELLSSELRQTTGRRPRGLSLCASSWESSLLASFTTCGMEYVLLDESLVPAEKQKWIPLIMSDKGKSLSILPVSTSLKPCAGLPPEEFLSAVQERISAVRGGSVEGGHAGVCIQFSTEELQQLLESGWLSRLEAADGEFLLATPYQYIKSVPERTPVYIAAGLGGEVAQWAVRPYESVRSDGGFPVTIYDFFQTYPQSRALYDRMLYVGQLVNQSHGDKLRRKAAREKLWEAQDGDGFVCTAKGAFVSSAYRQQAYKNLMEAEKILRECGSFAESVSSFDYTGNGMNEYVCRMKNYFACISLRGGAVRELDVVQNSGNFADNLSRVKEFDGCSDDYERGLFVDHLFTQEEFQDFVANKPTGNGIFSRMTYGEVKFSAQHK
ncbi:MAG: DUF1925 domain-containing protein, partial [Treponemataceae bacterium]|nr:DUF1925 domain-containing protein [Treponemataceae bacterium]